LPLPLNTSFPSPCPHPISLSLCSEHQFCGGRLEKPQGTLTTPNWPESDYPPGVSCSWLIIAPPEQVISLTFGKFDLEPDTYCRYDSVSIFNGAQSDDSKRLGKYCGDTAPSSITSEGNELLVQFVSDLSVTADGFSASYKAQPRGNGKEGIVPAPPQPQPGPKVKPPTKPQAPVQDNLKPTLATDSGAASTPCPKQCRRTGTLQSNFCTNDFVVTGAVKSMVRGPGEGITVTITLMGVYKAGALALSPTPVGTPLKLYVPCRQCPPIKKGASYLLMGSVDEKGSAVLSPNSFVVLYRPNQDQILTNLSKKKCPSQPPATA
ncbi:procollagen C-endopeptidase enhancer 1, partial [Petaurus breviceps papuanus]|uniref:procollagen C-endopeptidase enhancer 1 n=1 Tax=Petaurus breviceps papuanus TaxID=3040969 RepID=UPI0036DCED91